MNIDIDTRIYRNNYVKGIFLLDYMLRKQDPVNISELSYILKKYYENNLGHNITENSARRILKRDILDKFLYKHKLVISFKNGRNRYLILTPVGLYLLDRLQLLGTDYNFLIMKYIELILPPLKGLGDIYIIFHKIAYSEEIEWEKENDVYVLINSRYKLETLSFLVDFVFKGKLSLDETEKKLVQVIEKALQETQGKSELKILMDMVYEEFSKWSVELFNEVNPQNLQDYLNIYIKYRKKIDELVKNGDISILLDKMLSCTLLDNVAETIQRELAILVLSGFSYDDVIRKINEYLKTKEKICNEFYNMLVNELTKLILE